MLWLFSLFVELDEMIMMTLFLFFLSLWYAHEDGVMSVLFLEAVHLGDR